MRREWPASDVMGSLTSEDGKRVVKTCGVHAPDVMTRREQGRSASVPLAWRIRIP